MTESQILASQQTAEGSAPGAARHLKLVVGIATRGRPLILAETIADLAQQTRVADRVIVSYAEDADLGGMEHQFPHVVFTRSELGLTKQRNSILDLAVDFDLIVFLDDDFYLDSGYLQVTERLFLEKGEVLVATGTVLADGINGTGLGVAEARAILARSSTQNGTGEIRPAFNAYGCNMCLRLQPIREHGLRFDERLPLYGWYEDVDFSRQLARFGTVIRMQDAHGVHLGAKSGRTSGARLGYSQVANPLYLARKGTFPWSHALASIATRFCKNLVLSLAPEPYVDRRGRLRGNLVAVRDLVTGRLSPERALTL